MAPRYSLLVSPVICLLYICISVVTDYIFSLMSDLFGVVVLYVLLYLVCLDFGGSILSNLWLAIHSIFGHDEFKACLSNNTNVKSHVMHATIFCMN